MRPRLSFAALGFAVVGLGASIASLVDHASASATFCAETGCATVRESAWATPLGIPLPMIGIAFYLAAIALCFVAAPRLRLALAITGAAGALVLIGLQAFVIGAWCKLCLVADPAAIGYAVAVLAGASALRFTLARGAVALPALLAIVGGLALWTRSAPPVEPTAPIAHAGHAGHAGHAAPATPTAALPPGTPAFVVQAQVAGATTVVEVVDFECPFCRRMHDRLTAAIARARQPVHIVRKMLPLDNHPGAMPAALAYCCAELQGKGEEMAAALFAADPSELTTEGCEKIAASIGCDLERYRFDMAAAKQRVAADTAEMRAAGIRSLPTTFIGGQRLVGAGASVEQLVALLDR
jgi:protein-disulfide isomerase/uncharacterized membrane protein